MQFFSSLLSADDRWPSLDSLPVDTQIQVQIARDLNIPAGDEVTPAGLSFAKGDPQSTLTPIEKHGLHCRVLGHFIDQLDAHTTLHGLNPRSPYLVGEAPASQSPPLPAQIVSRTSFTFWKESEHQNLAGRLIIDCQKPGTGSVSIDELNQVFQGWFVFSISPFRESPVSAAGSQSSSSTSLRSKSFWRSLLPSFIVTQTGGYIGYVTAGTGWKIGDHFDVSVQVGYVPPGGSGVAFWQFSAKTEWHPFSHLQIEIPAGKSPVLIDPAYVGLSMIYTPSSKFFLRLPDRYPERGYYEENALRFAPYVGAGVARGPHHVFIEATALDVELRWYFLDHHEFKPEDLKNLGTLGAGYRYVF